MTRIDTLDRSYQQELATVAYFDDCIRHARMVEEQTPETVIAFRHAQLLFRIALERSIGVQRTNVFHDTSTPAWCFFCVLDDIFDDAFARIVCSSRKYANTKLSVASMLDTQPWRLTPFKVLEQL